MKVLVINCGSSSVKYQLLGMSTESALVRGLIERVGTSSALLTQQGEAGKAPLTVEFPCPTHQAGIDAALQHLAESDGLAGSLDAVDAVGHRVVHAGERYTGSVRIDDDVVAALEECTELAPLHNPPNLAGIAACRSRLPDVPHVAVFDNALHHTLPRGVFTYALPWELCQRYGVRRYGFHGIAFRSAHDKAAHLLSSNLAHLRIVTLMLGSGCTANALCYGKSVEVSTGFTPLEGLIQSTRCGDVDTAAVLYLMEKEGLTPAEATSVLNRQSGWSGISGCGQDMRDVMAAAEAGNERAQTAIEAFVHRCRKYVGGYAAAMGGVDLLIFCGGVGAKAHELRSRICNGLKFMGLALDADRNAAAAGDAVISKQGSPSLIVTVEVDEELVIARDTVSVISATG